MAEYNPLGSEKLNADEKLKRILELTYYGNNKKTSTSTKAELVKESKSGGVYAIVKEKDGFYVKRGLNESSLDYIGGMFMKNKNRFSSYADAYKRLNLLEGQESLQEATKYVLKQKPPMENEATAPAPVEPTPAPAAAPSPEPDAPTPTSEPDAPSDMNATPETGATEPTASDDKGEGMRSSYMEEIQKFAGKLGQELRDQHERLESDDIKYVLNMVISAVDLDKLSDEDLEELGKKFDRDEEEGATEPTTDNEKTPATEPTTPESDLSENDPMSKLAEFVDSPNLGEVNLSDYTIDEEDMAPEEHEYHAPNDEDVTSDDLGWEEDGIGHGEHDAEDDLDKLNYHNEPDTQDLNEYEIDESDEDNEKEIDLEEIKNQISRAVGETLSKHFS